MAEEGAPEDQDAADDPSRSPDWLATSSLGGSDPPPADGAHSSLGTLGLPDLVEGATMGGYRVLGRLGAGAIGAVYLGLDRDRKEPVAIKRLHRLDARGLLRLKNEFRRVQSLSHRNLVQVHELIEERGNYYLTLEYIDGVSFREWVLSGLSSLPGRSTRPDTERLRQALRELVEGVQTLHEAGLLHRDLKPANVLVDRTGRVVVLDFGLVEDADMPAVDEASIAGTPAYMAPEQARGEPSTPAVDWYAVGVMLFEVLTGRLPFRGGVMQILYQKQKSEPPRPSDLRPSVPSDLDALCVALMRPKPEERPTGPQVMAWLGLRAPEPGLGETSFVGQEDGLTQLHRALHRVREGQAATVLVQGPSGVGKTALVRTFLNSVPADTVVLRGRCYERETVPFKGFDSLIDELAGHLARRPRKEVLPLLPREVRDLARVFPVLMGVKAVAQAPDLRASAADPLEVRRRAFRGLKELLSRMADRSTLVLFVDDLQWGDLGSARLLTELLSPPDPPALLFVASVRSEDLGRSAFAAELKRFAAQGDVGVLEVQELPHDQAMALAWSSLGGQHEADRWRAEAIARESRGNPYFLQELVRHALDHPTNPEASAGRIALSTVVATRLHELPEAERALAEIVSVAGRPLPQGLAQQAAGGLKKPLSVWARLRSVHLVRTHGARGADPVEPFHDRIREQILAQLSPAREKAHHCALVEAMEGAALDDPERLAHHCLEGGLTEKAGQYATQAADRALQALAFERAADFLDQAIACTTDDEARRALFVRRAEALAATGRCAEAAPILLEARAGLPDSAARALTARAAELYLTSGHAEEGLAQIRSLLRSLDLRLPRSALAARAAVLWTAGLEVLRGRRMVERSAIPEALTSRVDLAWSAGRGLLLWRPDFGGSLLLRSLRLARSAGDARRTARGLIARALLTVGFANGLALRGLEQAEELAERLDDEYLRGFSRATRGVMAVHAGRWSEGLTMLDEGCAILAERCIGTAWELSIFTSMTARALRTTGATRELERRAPRWLRTANQRGDIYLRSLAELSGSWLLAIEGDVPGARAQLAGLAEHWPAEARHVQRYQVLTQSVVLDLHERQPLHALLRLRKAWPWLRGSHLVLSPDTRVELLQLLGQASLAVAATGDRDRKKLLRTGRRCAFWLRRHRHRDALGAAAAVEAAWSFQTGRTDRALRALDRASSHWQRAGRRLQAAAARRRKGMLLGGEEGAALVTEADRFLAEQGIIRPGSWTEALVAGFGA